MSPRVCLAALSLSSLLLHGGALLAQGTVQDHGPRHVIALASDEICELWRGDIHGNDPSAEISVQLCTRDGHVTGTFSWSSRESGWDRRALEGEWREDGTLLVARDTAMIEAHALNGWTLCTSDSYTLRRVSPERLEGSYVSERCRDHGHLVMTLRPAPVQAAKTDAAPLAPAHVSFDAGLAHAAHHQTARCSAIPGMNTGSGVWGVVMAFVAAVATRRRQRA